MKKHFTPKSGWMNDPNGTIVIDNIYHIFYQYYPDGIKWGPMHWGHATSQDGISWEHRDIAIYPDKLGYIFSGSCVLDKENVSGFGDGKRAPLLAFYTSHNPDTGEQQQSVAYSLDYEHFTPYSGNPIIKNTLDQDTYMKDFRDPKVFKNPYIGGFSMVLAVGSSLFFYHSDNLLAFEKTGEFAIESVGLTGVCECPDCFPVTDSKWILSFSLCGNEGPNIMPYFVGTFNGNCFIPDCLNGNCFIPDGLDCDCLITESLSGNPPLLDYGPDNYAAVTFSNTSSTLLMGWGENWTYAQDTPATMVRGKMTCIKEAKLIETDNGKRLSFDPINDSPSQTYDISVGDSMEIPTPSGGIIEILVTDKTITVSRKKAVLNKFHDCFEDSRYLIFTAQRNFTGPSHIDIYEDEGFFEIFADKNTLSFSVNTY